MSKYVIEFEDNPWYQDDYVGYYKCSEIPWWSAKKSDIKKLTPLDKALEEAYQKGLHDGTARNENGCVGCIYDNGRIDHSPCDYCCNAYSNQWLAKEKSDEIKVGDEVEAYSGRAIVFGTFTDTKGNKFCRYWYPSDDSFNKDKTENLKRTCRHFPQVAELLEAMKGGAE